MSSTTSRFSVVALSTLAALVAQELARTANVAPSTVGSVSEAEDQKGVQPIANPKLTQPVAQPETLPAKPLTGKKQSVKAQKGKLAKSQAFAEPSKVLSRSGEPTPVLATNEPLPVPLPTPRIHQPLQPVNVDSLPIDAFVSATLRQSASKVASATAQISSVKATRPKAAKSTVKKPLPQRAIATSQPQERQSTQATKVATLPDIQNHPSQKAIEGLMQRGVIHGFQNGTFRPDDPVSDIEFKIMLRNAFKRSPESVAGIQRPSDVVTRADAAEFVYAQLQRAEMLTKAKELPAQLANPPAMNAAAVSTPETMAVEKGGGPAQVDQLATTPTSTQLPDRPTAQPVRLPTQALPGQTPFKQATAMPPRGMPATSLTPAQEDYTLGPGDRIKVEIFGVPEYSRDYQVLVNGNLKLYLVGDLRVQGLTLTQVEKAIAARYARLLQRIKVDVTLTAPRPMNVAIAGEISKPGSYTVASGEGAQFPTVTRLIQQAGGITQSANPNVVYVRRPQANGTDQLITVDLWDLFKTGNIRQDLTLRDGDMVFIPAADQINPADGAQLAAANFAASASQPLNIAIIGEVARPGPYVLSRGRGGSGTGGSGDGGSGASGGLITVTQAIQQAGGITALADLRNVQVKRTTRSTEPQVITLNLWDMLKTGDLSQDLVLQQGDTITVPTATAINPAEASQLGTASFAPDVIRVNVVGEVVSPGSVQVPPNTTLNQAILAAGGFNNKRAYKKTVELIRLNPNGTATRVSVPVDLSRGIDEKNNPILRNNDIIIVNRSGLARFTDTLDTILGPVNRLLPFFLLGL